MNKLILVAKAVSELSKDTTKVGAIVISKEGLVIGVGVNGYPPGYDDLDTSYKHDKVIHAEVNALINSRASRGEVESLYVYGLPPCKDCMKYIAAFLVKEVHFCVNTDIASAQDWYVSHNTHKVLHHNIRFIEHENN